MAESPCTKCGTITNDKKNYRLTNPELCFSCNFWYEKTLEKDKLLIVNGWVYGDGGRQPEGTKYLGFAGRWFRYRRLGETEWHDTNNMWGGGEVPPNWKEELPDNAEFENVRRTDFPNNKDGSEPKYTQAWDMAPIVPQPVKCSNTPEGQAAIQKYKEMNKDGL